MLSKTRWIGGLLACLLAQGVAQAQDKFDEFSLKMSNAVPADRFFMRAGVIGIKIKTNAEDTYDVTGPVVTRDELQALMDDRSAIEASILLRDPVGGAAPNGTRPGSPTVANSIASLLGGTGTVSVQQILNQMDADGITQLGTPAGIKAVAENAMTAGLSLGYYLGDDYSWVVEAYVLAKPVEASVVGTGLPTWRNTTGSLVEPRPFGLEGQKIVTTKILPPTVMLGKYWGHKDSKFRLYTGAVAMYGLFYDTKATDALNNYVGGGSPGDTTVSLKNAFGLGPMLGAKLQINDAWHASLNIGSVRLKAQATLVTRNTFITNETGAIQDYGRPISGPSAGGSVSDTLETAENLFLPTTPGSVGSAAAQALIAKLGGATGVSLGAVAYNRGQTNLGTYVRKTNVTLQNTIFMLSVGRSF